MSSRFLNLAFLWCFEKKIFWKNHEISGLILITFLLEAVEASLSYFWWLLVDETQKSKPLEAPRHHNSSKSQFYYPSEPSSFHHFNVRHPIEPTHPNRHPSTKFSFSWRTPLSTFQVVRTSWMSFLATGASYKERALVCHSLIYILNLVWNGALSKN